MDGFAAFFLCHMVTGTLLYKTHATLDEILAANRNLAELGNPHRYIPAPENAEIPLPTPI